MEIMKGIEDIPEGDSFPSDWEKKEIQKVCILVNGRGFKPHEWKTQGLPIIRIQNLNGSPDFNYFSGPYDSKIEVENGQLLFAWSGSRGTSFGPHVWKGQKGLLNYHTWKVRVNEEKINGQFFFHALKRLTKIIEDKAHGASALVHTQKWEMEGFTFPCPPTIQEQAAIAEVLSDTDALIQSLEKLLEKKKMIKQGMMQELLRPKEGWEEKSLGEIGYFHKGKGVRKDQAASGEIPCIRYGELYTHHNDQIIDFHSFISGEIASESQPIQKGDVLFAGSGEKKEEIGKCAAFLGDFKAYAGGDIVILRPTEVNSLFLSYLCNSDYVAPQRASFAQGDAVVHISGKNLASIQICVPESQDEQNQIAMAISDADSSIREMQSLIMKNRRIKTALMQQLLTGKIRLI